MRPLKITACVGLLCASSACSFFGKVPPLKPRFFEAEAGGEGPHKPVDTSAPGLRLGHVVGATHLRELIAFHVAEHELGFYEQRRWTERPESFVRRALSRALFEERGLQNVVSAAAPTLEVELTDFSELLEPSHAVRVRVRVVLVDQRRVRFERTFSVEQAVAKGDDFALVPAAMSEALERCVDQVADAVLGELSTPR
jgi:cholesterol transport system auxiliary component